MENTAPAPKKKNLFTTLYESLLDNPVIIKELRGRMRGRQAFILLTVYLGLIALFIFLVYNVLFGISTATRWDPSSRQEAGKAIFGTVVLLELLLLSFIAPGLTAGTITSERERQTFDLLRTTLLSARAFVFGKLGSAFSYLFLLILAGIPIQSIAFILGGVGLGETVVSGVMLVVTAIFYCTLGIFFSSIMRRTLAATISSYAFILLSFLAIAAMFFIIAYIETFSYSSNPLSKFTEYTLIAILWFLISTNPLVAAIMTEVILIDQQSLFITNSSMFGSNGPSHLISPWIIYVSFYTLLTLLLFLLSIYFVKRPDK